MEDLSIVELYWQRNEAAITETDAKYGAFCRRLALNLLGIREDAEECVNDTYHRAWLSMPTQRPLNLRAWLGRVVRNLSIDLYRKNRAKKRYAGIEILLSELDECVPSSDSVESSIEAAELGRVIDGWLMSLTEDERIIFIRRYWNGERLKDISSRLGIPAGNLAQKMSGLRRNLKAALEKEGIVL